MSDGGGWVDPLVLLSALLYLAVVPFLAALGTFIDARRRVPPREAAIWGVTMLCAYPLALPLYLWRAYRKPETRPEPLAVLPWARAFLYLTGLLIALTIGGVAAFAIELALERLPEGALGAGERTVLCAGLGEAPFVIAWTYLCRRVLDLEAPTTLGTPFTRRAWGEAVLGALVGLLGPAGVLACWACFGRVHIAWRPEWPSLAVPLALAPAFALAAFQEEVAFRGYLQRNLAASWGTVAAVAVASALFAAAHGLNDGATALGIANCGLIGTFLALTVLLTGRLWFAVGFHFLWNYTLGVLLELPVSGVTLRGGMRVAYDGPGWLTGGDFGPEASIATTAVTAALALAALLCARRSRRQPELLAGPREAEPVDAPTREEAAEVPDVRDPIVPEEAEEIAPHHGREPEDEDEEAGDQLGQQ
jgi:uncharacterized protein